MDDDREEDLGGGVHLSGCRQLNCKVSRQLLRLTGEE